MKNLEIKRADKIDRVSFPTNFSPLQLNDSALSLFRDFREYSPSSVLKNFSANEAEKFMANSHAEICLVMDRDEKFIGLISMEDLSKQELVRWVSNGYHRDELTVRDLMHGKDELHTLLYSDVEKASVGDIIDLLKFGGLHYLLIQDDETSELRGVIASSEIQRRLNKPIHIGTGSDFVKIFKAIHP